MRSRSACAVAADSPEGADLVGFDMSRGGARQPTSSVATSRGSGGGAVRLGELCVGGPVVRLEEEDQRGVEDEHAEHFEGLLGDVGAHVEPVLEPASVYCDQAADGLEAHGSRDVDEA